MSPPPSFFSEPDEYEGGELVIEDTFGHQSVKLAAGDAIVYPGSSLHRVNPVTRGTALRLVFLDTKPDQVLTSSAGCSLIWTKASRHLTADYPAHPKISALSAPTTTCCACGREA